MRVLHLVKTSDGATWAALQVAELVRLGVEVHVALPRLEGRMAGAWRESGARLHPLEADLPLAEPWRVVDRVLGLRRLVADLRPDLVHSHFVGTTLLMRLALGRRHRTPRLFQVPGPLHLEHPFYRRLELALAGPADRWIGGSRHVSGLYLRAGVAPARLFTSHYGTRVDAVGGDRGGHLRRRLGIRPDAFLAGNVSYIYPPKRLLGQRVGLKGHEILIEAIALARRARPQVVGLLAGGTFGRDTGYEARLRALAAAAGDGAIHMPGVLPPAEAAAAWTELDCALHAPLSENCGGVVEPLLAGVPVVAARVGGLPEVIADGRTGRLVPPRDPRSLAEALIEVVDDPARHRALAASGRRLVRAMFDVGRTAREVREIYDCVLDPDRPRPRPFDPARFLAQDDQAPAPGGAPAGPEGP